MYQRRYGPPQQAEHLAGLRKTHPSYQCMILGMKRRTLPRNLSFWILLETSLNTKSDNKFQQRFFQFQAEQQQTLALPRARAPLLNRRSPPLPTFFWKLGKDGKLTPQEHQCHLDNKFCLFCGTTGHVTKDCPKYSLASTKAWVSKSDQGKSVSSGTDLKKTEQSLNSAQPEDCIELPHAKTLTLNASALSKSWLTHSFPDIQHPSRYGLEVPCGFRIFRLFHWSVFVQTQHLPSIWNSTYQTPTPRWNFQFCHLAGTRLANLFSYWESQNLTFYVTPLDQSCMIVLGYCGSPTTIPQLTGYWAASFSGNCRSMNPRAHPLSRHFCHWHPFRNFWTLSWIFQNQFCW